MLPNIVKCQRSRLLGLLSYSTSSKPFQTLRSAQSPGQDQTQDKDVLPKKSHPDRFGTLARDWRLNKTLNSMPEEEGDQVEVAYLEGKEGKTRLRTKEYADMIKQLLKEKRIPDAIDVLEKRILKEDKAPPETYIYNILICACARVGYTKKAFQLYNQMKKRALKVTGGTYTSLFNACANSPIEGDGLKRARHLRELMKEKFYVPNQTNYHAMIKAFGRCGDICTAFSLVDEMSSNNVQISSETFNFLLQTCASDREAGFRHAILTWRKMIEKNVSPTIFTYNLLLRCVRDCRLGNKEVAIEEIRRITGTEPIKLEEILEQNLLEEGTQEKTPIDAPKDALMVLPNLIALKPHGGNFLYIGSETKPKHRLMLLGGCEGFLDQMNFNNVSPDIKTVTVLLECVPSTLESETSILNAIDKYKIPIDIDFCNSLIKRRNMRHHYKDAKDVLAIIHKNRLIPNIVTFGVLALGCRSTKECSQLLDDIKEAGYRVNIEILGSLLRSACSTWDIGMVIQLMKMVQTEEMNPNKYIMKHLEEFHNRVQNEIKINDISGTPHKKIKDKYFMQGFKKFCYFYKQWKSEVSVEDLEAIHPWKQFKREKAG